MQFAQVLEPSVLTSDAPTAEVLSGYTFLPIGQQGIPVRALTKDPHQSCEDHALLLSQVMHSMCQDFHLEQYLVLHQSPEHIIAGVRERFAAVHNRILHVGALADFNRWAQARMGPVAGMSKESPVRRLCEHLLSTRARGYGDLVVQSSCAGYEGSKISADFKFGQLGCDAVATLFSRSLGSANVQSVEGIPAYQDMGVDLLVQAQPGCAPLKVEVKTEKPLTGNIALEHLGNVRSQTGGWLWTSDADVLVSVFWETGEAFFLDLKKVRAWVRDHVSSIPLVYGMSLSATNNRSQVYLGSIKRLMADIPDVAYLNMFEWLPELAALHESQDARWSRRPPCLLPKQHQGRVISPRVLHKKI